jgi:TRIAD3 protein (E3 ubiquitin-protein ligase RNF216)
MATHLGARPTEVIILDESDDTDTESDFDFDAPPTYLRGGANARTRIVPIEIDNSRIIDLVDSDFDPPTDWEIPLDIEDEVQPQDVKPAQDVQPAPSLPQTHAFFDPHPPQTFTEDDCLQKVLDIFPDIAHDHVLSLYREGLHDGVSGSDWCDRLITQLLDNGPYPKERERRKNLKRKRSDSNDEVAIKKFESLERDNGGYAYCQLA